MMEMHGTYGTGLSTAAIARILDQTPILGSHQFDHDILSNDFRLTALFDLEINPLDNEAVMTAILLLS